MVKMAKWAWEKHGFDNIWQGWMCHWYKIENKLMQPFIFILKPWKRYCHDCGVLNPPFEAFKPSTMPPMHLKTSSNGKKPVWRPMERSQTRMGAQNKISDLCWCVGRAASAWVAHLLHGSLCLGGSLLPHSEFCRKLLEAFPVSKSGVW